MCFFLFSQKEPDDSDRKKKTLKSKIKGSKPSHTDSKPNISYPTNFEHTVHVGFDAVTGEFTVSFLLCSSMDTFSRVCLAIMPTAFCLRIASRKSSVFTACVRVCGLKENVSSGFHATLFWISTLLLPNFQPKNKATKCQQAGMPQCPFPRY